MDEPQLEDKKIWHIPLLFKTPSGPETTSENFHWLSKQSDIIILPEIKTPYDWVLFNSHSSGYYRVNYDTYNWIQLIKHLKNDDLKYIPPVDRAVLIDNSLLLARAGQLDYEIPLELLQYLARETDYIPWFAAVDNLEGLLIIFSGSEIEELLNVNYCNYEIKIKLILIRLYRLKYKKWSSQYSINSVLAKFKENHDQISFFDHS